MEKVDLVIFDMDGLMFDSERISFLSWQEAAKPYGYEISKGLFNETLGTNKETTCQLLKDHFGCEFPFEAVFASRARFSNDIIERDGLKIKPGLHELLTFLKDKKIKHALATSASRNRAEKYLQISGLEGVFDLIVCGDQVSHSKPHPEIFLKTCQKLQVKANQTLVLEDSDAGIEAAYAAGMIPVMIPDIKPPSERSKENAYRILDNLSQVMALMKRV